MILKNNYVDMLIKAIDEEAEKIDVIMYLISPGYQVKNGSVEEIFRKLKEAKDRGVKVRIITDFPRSLVFAQEFDIEAKMTTSVRRLHAKAVIFSEKAIVGSHNWTKMGLQNNSELSVLTNDFEEIQELNRIFEELWNS